MRTCDSILRREWFIHEEAAFVCKEIVRQRVFVRYLVRVIMSKVFFLLEHADKFYKSISIRNLAYSYITRGKNYNSTVYAID